MTANAVIPQVILQDANISSGNRFNITSLKTMLEHRLRKANWDPGKVLFNERVASATAEKRRVENIWVEQIRGRKNLGSKKFGVEEIWGRQNLESKKTWGRKS